MKPHRLSPLSANKFPVAGFMRHERYVNAGPEDGRVRMPSVQSESDVLAIVRNEFGIDHYEPRHVPVIPLRVECIFGYGLADGVFVREDDYIVMGAYRDGTPLLDHEYPPIPYEYDHPDEGEPCLCCGHATWCDCGMEGKGYKP